VIGTVAAFQHFAVVEIPVGAWLDGWLPGLQRDGLLVGVNWAGPHATGFDMPPVLVAGWFAGLP
jgi:hypothetical protein